MLDNPFPFDPLPADDGEDTSTDTANPIQQSALQQGRDIPAGWKPTVAKPLPVVRCTGKVRSGPREGQRCGRWSIEGHDKCLVHGGQLPNVRKAAQAKVEAARMRLIEDVDVAVETLLELMQPGTVAAVRLKAAESVLDRVGLKAGTELNVTVEQKASAAEEIQKRLNQIASRLNPDPEDELESDDLENLGEVDNPPADE